MDEKFDMIDEAYMQMGGFGKVQKVSYVINTLAQSAAAYIVYCIVFLEKHPAYICIEDYKNRPIEEMQWQPCTRDEFCNDHSITWRVNWTSPDSLHNVIESLDMFCRPDW